MLESHVRLVIGILGVEVIIGVRVAHCLKSWREDLCISIDVDVRLSGFQCDTMKVFLRKCPIGCHCATNECIDRYARSTTVKGAVAALGREHPAAIARGILERDVCTLNAVTKQETASPIVGIPESANWTHRLGRFRVSIIA